MTSFRHVPYVACVALDGNLASYIVVVCSAALRLSLEDQKAAADERLTAERARLQRQLDTVRDEQKDAETRLETQRRSASQHLELQRQGTFCVLSRPTSDDR